MWYPGRSVRYALIAVTDDKNLGSFWDCKCDKHYSEEVVDESFSRCYICKKCGKKRLGMSSFPWNTHDTDRNVSKYKNVNSKWKVSKKV